MKIERVLLGRAVRLLEVSGPGGGEIYGRKLSSALEDRYGFLQGPRTIEDFSLEKGIGFLHGYFDNRAVIDRLQIFNTGVVVETKTDTSLCEEFVDDLLDWVRTTSRVSVRDRPEMPRFFTSQLEVKTETTLGKRFEKLNEFGRVISAAMRSYGQPSQSVELASIGYVAEGSGQPHFRFERREGVPDKQIYFSIAPLRTADHLEILKAFDEAFTSETSAS